MEQNRNWKKFSVNRNCAEVCNDQCSLINFGLCIVILPLLLSSSINIALSRCDNEIYVYTLFVKEQKKTKTHWLQLNDFGLSDYVLMITFDWKKWFFVFHWTERIFTTVAHVLLQTLPSLVFIFFCSEYFFNLFSGGNSTFFQVAIQPFFRCQVLFLL